MVKKYLQVKSVYYYLDMTKVRVGWTIKQKMKLPSPQIRFLKTVILLK